MSATYAICYDCDSTLPMARRRVLEDVYSGLTLAATVEAQRGSQYLARHVARQARALVVAFGVRREKRREITAAMIAATLADVDARIAAKRAQSAQGGAA